MKIRELIDLMDEKEHICIEDIDKLIDDANYTAVLPVI